MFCCHHLEILDTFWTRTSYFSFCLELTNYVACPGPQSDSGNLRSFDGLLHVAAGVEMLAQRRELQDIPETWVQPSLNGSPGMIVFKLYRQRTRVAIIHPVLSMGPQQKVKNKIIFKILEEIKLKIKLLRKCYESSGTKQWMK